MIYHIPMCVFCGDREVQIVVNSVGSGFCSTECENLANKQDEEKEHFDSLLTKQYDSDNRGPTAVAGLTVREYRQAQAEWDEEQQNYFDYINER